MKIFNLWTSPEKGKHMRSEQNKSCQMNLEKWKDYLATFNNELTDS